MRTSLRKHTYKTHASITTIIIIAFGPYCSTGHLQHLSRHPDPGPASLAVIIFIVIIAFGPYCSTGRLQHLSRHPDPGPASRAVIIFIVIGVGTGRLQQLSRHPDPGPVSLAVINIIIIIIIAFGPYSTSPGIPIPDQPLKLSTGVTHPLCFSRQIMAPGVSWAASLSLSQWVPGQGLMCDTGPWLSGGVSNPSPASLEDRIFCWLLLGPFPEFSAPYSLRPSDPKDFSKAGVDECLDLQCRSRVSPCFGSIQRYRFYCGAKDPDFVVDGQVR